jgi:hypothetical protein
MRKESILLENNARHRVLVFRRWGKHYAFTFSVHTLRFVSELPKGYNAYVFEALDPVIKFRRNSTFIFKISFKMSGTYYPVTHYHIQDERSHQP